MDFVQRNLINERNNLQVELAKAKAIIAELSEMATTPKREQEHMDSLKQTMRGIASAAGRFRAAPYGDGVEAKFDDRINAAYNQLRGINTERRSRKLIDAGGKVVKPSKSQKPSDTTPHDLTYKGTEGSEYGHISGIVRQMRKAHKRTLSEMRVVDSMKSGGVGSAINAVKSNIKQRGILGGLGINPKKGFVNKLGVPLVKGDDGNLSEPIIGTVDKSSKGRAANRVIIGAAESEIMSQASFGPSNIKKVKRGETMIKNPINPHYGIEGTAQYEQAEYISDLENVIISIAEQLGVHPNDLLNELNVGGAIKSGFKAGGVMGAIKRGANAVGHNVKRTLRGGSVIPTAANRADSTAKQVGANYDQAKTAANPDGGDAFEVGMADKHVKIAGKALQGVRKITRNRGMDDAVSPALDDIRKSGY